MSTTISTPVRSFSDLIQSRDSSSQGPDDLVFTMIVLMRQVSQLHLQGLVANLAPDNILESADGQFCLKQAVGMYPRLRSDVLLRMQPRSSSALNIVGNYRVTTDQQQGSQVNNLLVLEALPEPQTSPVFLTRYRCWELEVRHHDEQVDIFLLGQILASLACGLNFYEIEDLSNFASNQHNLFRINPQLNPVIANLIGEMTALDRAARTSDLAALVNRFEHYREQPISLDVERALNNVEGAPARRVAVLKHLRDRLFDLSRRNKLIHFRPTQTSVNLTMASVPLVTRLEAIRADQLCTWQGKFAQEVWQCKPISLNQWLRFEDQPYLKSSLDKLIQETRRDRADYGFSNLRLVLAFMKWTNLKDAPEDPILSPLLWLSADLVKKKGVRDQYALQATSDEAQINPALRHYLKQLYDIQLPEFIDLEKITVEQLHNDIAAQIAKSEPNVTLALESKPEIRLIHEKAVQRMRQFQRRQRETQKNGEFTMPDFSYERDNYQPLGRALFLRYVQVKALPQRLATGGNSRPSIQHMIGGAERATISISKTASHRYDWRIDLTQVTLANFNYKKMSLVHDYNQLIETGGQLPGFDQVFSVEPKKLSSQTPQALALQEQWDVVAADTTQREAVAFARGGSGFIIQGPPGTGKSQTITNLIADYAARSKRVLFVCEKRAALDVVFHRLQLAKLDSLCCLIHDAVDDKRAFIGNLKEEYESWTKTASSNNEAQGARDAIIQTHEHHLSVLARFELAMQKIPPETALSLRTLLQRWENLRDVKFSIETRDAQRLPSIALWDHNAHLTRAMENAFEQRRNLSTISAHPFSRLGKSIVSDGNAYAKIDATLAQTLVQIDQLDEKYEAITIAQALLIASTASRLIETNLSAHLDCLSEKSSASAGLTQTLAGLQKANDKLNQALLNTINWRDPLSPGDAKAALAQARKQEGTFFKFLSGTWRRLRAAIDQRYDFSNHAVRPTIVSILEKLVLAQDATDESTQAKIAADAHWGTKDLNDFVQYKDLLIQQCAQYPQLQDLLAKISDDVNPQSHFQQEARPLAILVNINETLQSQFLDFTEMPIARLSEQLRDMQEALEDLPDLLPALKQIHSGDETYALAMLTLPLSTQQLEAAVLAEGITRLLRSEPELIEINSKIVLAASHRIASARQELNAANSVGICASRHAQFLANLKRSNQSVSQLDDQGKDFKKRYSTGRRELEHEFGKVIRFRSIRELSGGDSGLVINDLKPIWLMSPLSVSDALPLLSKLFDVVIFDEASQIPMEDAIPALCRAEQVIVVGDENQLPPTSFFSTNLNDDDTLVTAQEGDDKIAILMDADSLLIQAARNLDGTMLAWHYRSRSESLISFSNAAFYKGGLITIPDIQTSVPELDKAQEDLSLGDLACHQTLRQPISFHKLDNGIYTDRTNLKEAQYIAQMVRSILTTQSGKTIGIVAFSEAQQTSIEDALDNLAESDKAFDAALEQEFVREEDGQFIGLFVKNLENVQGDERDIIILSICYGPDASGRMAMNFGPINQRGGEKRLNVIFSRSKHHMAVVTSITGDRITNTHNDGARALQAFLNFAQARANGDSDYAQSVLSALNPDAGRVFGAKMAYDSVRVAIALALRTRGHTVTENVGSAKFRCDLAVSGSDPTRYRLAILLDRDIPTTAPALEEFYVFRPQILRSFGWRVLPISSLDWNRDPQSVLTRIEAGLEHDHPEVFNGDPPDGREFIKTANSSAVLAPTTAELSGAIAMDMKEFRFKDAGSDKFWKIGIQDTEITVVYGRVGTQGQTNIKKYESPERAQREMNKLILEKTKKGYVE